jgi:hypothetical protein
MTKDTPAIRDDLADLANKATTPITPSTETITDKAGENIAEANKRLAAGLDRVRGEAIQRAKAANTRLRHRALGATTLCFALGAFLGRVLARKRCKV